MGRAKEMCAWHRPISPHLILLPPLASLNDRSPFTGRAKGERGRWDGIEENYNHGD